MKPARFLLARSCRLIATATSGLALARLLMITSSQRLRPGKLLRRAQCASRRPHAGAKPRLGGIVRGFRVRVAPVGGAGWIRLCHRGQPLSARLRALGKELVALGDEQHIALACCIAHGARHRARFNLKLPPTGRPTSSLHNLIFDVPLVCRHGAKIPPTCAPGPSFGPSQNVHARRLFQVGGGKVVQALPLRSLPPPPAENPGLRAIDAPWPWPMLPPAVCWWGAAAILARI